MKFPALTRLKITLLCLFSIIILSNKLIAQNTSPTGENNTMPAGTDITILNSYQEGEFLIYIDTDGEQITDSYWINQSTTPTASYIDQLIPGLTNQQVYMIWQIISEDFRPFNVNVTTNRALYDAMPSHKKQMLIVGPKTNDWIGFSTTGLGRTGGFSISESPAFVWTTGVGLDANLIGEVGSHEIGHAFSLLHDGIKNGASYYSGHGNWGTIMGSGYYKNITQWSAADYKDGVDDGWYSSGQNQDDIAILTSTLGLRPDDHGNNLNAASSLYISSTLVDIKNNHGVIESSDDEDYFKFSTTGGTINLHFEGAYPRPNLDILVTLYNASGTQLLTADVADDDYADIAMGLASGTYYLKIEGTGFGDPLTTGYTDYGSLGYYGISGTITNATEIAEVQIVSHSNFDIIQASSLAVTKLEANVVSSTGISKVEYLINGLTYSGNLSGGKYVYNWTPASFGDYEITVLVTETDGSTSEHSINLTIQAPFSLKQLQINAIGTQFCGDILAPSLMIANNGSSTINSFDLTVYVDDLPVAQQSYTTTMIKDQIESFVVNNVSIPTSGMKNIKIIPSNINGTSFPNNNSIIEYNTDVTHNGLTYKYYIDTEGIDKNMSWSLENSSIEIFNQNTASTSIINEKSVVSFCLIPDCYELTTLDALVEYGCTLQDWDVSLNYNPGTKLMYNGLLYTASSPITSGGDNPAVSAWWYTLNETCPSSNENLVIGLEDNNNNNEFEIKLGDYTGASSHSFCYDKTFTITYKGNENTTGNDPTDATTYSLNNQVTIGSKGSLVKNGFQFSGWNTAIDGSGIDYYYNNKFLISGNVVLFAQWELITSSQELSNISKLIAYPIPASDVLYIKGAKIDAKYKIYTINGTLIKNGLYTEGGISINNISKGLYILKTENSFNKFSVN